MTIFPSRLRIAQATVWTFFVLAAAAWLSTLTGCVTSKEERDTFNRKGGDVVRPVDPNYGAGKKP